MVNRILKVGEVLGLCDIRKAEKDNVKVGIRDIKDTEAKAHANTLDSDVTNVKPSKIHVFDNDISTRLTEDGLLRGDEVQINI